MAVDKKHKRLCVTFTKKQYDWIVGCSKRMDMTASKFVKFLVEKNIKNLLEYLPEDEFNQILKYIKVKWIRYPEDD